jgi:uncharacterized protein (DUF433 family)
MSTANGAENFLRSYDARRLPRYSVRHIAAYLNTAESTIRSWFFGMPYGQSPNIRHFKPILIPTGKTLLSFYDAASAHVLLALKAKSVPTEDIRAIVQSLNDQSPGGRYPLLGRNFYLFGRSVIIKEAGIRLNLSRGRQLGFRHIMDKFLRRLELDEEKMPVRFYPILDPNKRARAFIVIDPNLAGGRPVIKGTGIAAEVIAERRKSGESIAGLSKDYRLSRRAIEEAVEYSQKRAA